MASKEEEFWKACSSGNLDQVKSLSTHVNVNLGFGGLTGLHAACFHGKHEVIGFLLSLPHIDLNKKDRIGDTPLLLACLSGHDVIVRILAGDPRVDVNKADNKGATPLWWACRFGSVRAAQILLASGRANTEGRASERMNPPIATASEIARMQGHFRISGLIDVYERNPKELAQRLREELDWPTPASAVFAQMIFLCDGLLELSAREEPAQRFFSIASRLPLDLQHLLANRSQGLAADHVPTADRELAFTSLAGAFHEN